MICVINGKEFNKKYKDVEFYRLTNKNENHNGFQYKTGLNIDVNQIDFTHTTNVGGLYFTKKEHMKIWIEYDLQKMVYYRKVTIPDDAIVCETTYEFKTNKFILGEKHNICN